MGTCYDSDNLHSVDDVYLSALLGDEGIDEGCGTFPADAKYAEMLQLQEALMGSVLISRTKEVVNQIPDPDGSRSETKGKAVADDDKSLVIADSSRSFCGICMERKEKEQMFQSSSCCIHSYCLDCMEKHIVAKVHANVAVVTCPGFGCEVAFKLEACRLTLPKRVIEVWSDLLYCETIEASQRFYCPYKDCSAMMITDALCGEAKEGNIAEAECPFCHRLFCARCCVPWHDGLECEAYQRLNEDEKGRDDVMVMRLAEEKKWSRCPNCRFYVERTVGCPHMVCRCGFEFCYGCASKWTGYHEGCTRNRA